MSDSCNPMDCSPPGFPVHHQLPECTQIHVYCICAIFQARILEWIALSFSRGSSWPRDWPGFLHCRQILCHLSHCCCCCWVTSVMSDSVRLHRWSSPPGSSFPGILQARILEWVTISFSNACILVKLLQLCPTLCDPKDSSPPGSSVHGIL